MKVHAEIEYYRNGDGESVHSDICPPGCDSEEMNNPKWRKFIHACLDEWIDNSMGSGQFYISKEVDHV